MLGSVPVLPGTHWGFSELFWQCSHCVSPIAWLICLGEVSKFPVASIRLMYVGWVWTEYVSLYALCPFLMLSCLLQMA